MKNIEKLEEYIKEFVNLNKYKVVDINKAYIVSANTNIFYVIIEDSDYKYPANTRVNIKRYLPFMKFIPTSDNLKVLVFTDKIAEEFKPAIVEDKIDLSNAWKKFLKEKNYESENSNYKKLDCVSDIFEK